MKSIYVCFFLLICFLWSTQEVYGQHDQHDHHHHGRNEIGINSGALYAIDDKKWSSGVHVHYFRTLGDHSRWSVGGFVEQTFLSDSHFSFGLGVKYQLLEELYFSVLPGITFSEHTHAHDTEDHGHGAEKAKSKFSIHTELVYNLFRWEKFHMGPALDYSWSNGDSHLMFGIHAAFDF